MSTSADAAIGVIAERGVRGFSLAEASRRLGVTTAAPYRPFADRDDLLAAQQRPLFDTIYNSGLDKSRYPELQRAWEPVDALLTVVLEVCAGDAATAGPLADAVEASAHGHAMLLIDG